MSLGSEVTVSVVSHGHGIEVARLIPRLLEFPQVKRIILTMNAGLEECAYHDETRVCILLNEKPIGFGENHNNASLLCGSEFFCVLNPDVEFVENPFPLLLQSFKVKKVGVAAPRVKSFDGKIQDSIRKFPNIFSLAGKFFGFDFSRTCVDISQESQQVEWCAGMFMLFRTEVYKKISGFDQNFYLYYEDTDICARVRLAGYQIWLMADSWIIHDGKRGSRKSLKLFNYHVRSVLRYFVKYKFGFNCPEIVK